MQISKQPVKSFVSSKKPIKPKQHHPFEFLEEQKPTTKAQVKVAENLVKT